MRVLIDTLFPPLCLHCECKCPQLICKGCAPDFELIDPSSRCLFCFAENDGRRPCPECVQKKRWQIKIASAVDYQGAVSSLVKKLKYGKMPYLAKTAGALMLAQFFRLKWPIPDYIIPVPRRHWFQGMNHAALIANSFAKSLQVPALPLVKRRAGDLSQARLSKSQRERLSSTCFYLKTSLPLEEKTLLLIDDVMTTGTTLRHCSEALVSALPAHIYALTFARS